MVTDVAWDERETEIVVTYYDSVTIPYYFGTAGEDPQ
jgi:hypothetical protein